VREAIFKSCGPPPRTRSGTCSREPALLDRGSLAWRGGGRLRGRECAHAGHPAQESSRAWFLWTGLFIGASVAARLQRMAGAAGGRGLWLGLRDPPYASVTDPVLRCSRAATSGRGRRDHRRAWRRHLPARFSASGHDDRRFYGDTGFLSTGRARTGLDRSAGRLPSTLDVRSHTNGHATSCAWAPSSSTRWRWHWPTTCASSAPFAQASASA